jgi:hypothetical protein
MWIYREGIYKTFAVNDSEFDMIHAVVDGWVNYDYPNHLLFEHNGSFYIADDINDGHAGFELTVEAKRTNGVVFELFFNGSQWIYYFAHKDEQWKKINNAIQRGNYYADLNDSKLKPFNVNAGSDAIDETIDFIRLGSNLYKSQTLLGEYSFGGATIVVGKRKYHHVFEGTDVFLTETIELTELSTNLWSYTFNGVNYSYSGTLPLSGFTMTSAGGELNMIFDELVTIQRNILHFDGGAQIVD